MSANQACVIMLKMELIAMKNTLYRMGTRLYRLSE